MTTNIDLTRLTVAMILSGTCLTVNAAPSRLVLSAEVRAKDAQTILCPPSQNSPVVLRFYVPEGTMVKKGDPLVRIDPGQALSQVENLKNQLVQLTARVAKEVAQLDVLAIDAERAMVDAEATLEKSKIDAAIPAQNLAKLDYDRYQGALKRALLDLAQKKKEWQIAKEAIARRKSDAHLESERLRSDLVFNQAQLETAEQRATRDGVVIHAFENWRNGGRIDEGSSAWPGNRIGDVSGIGEVEVVAYALESERQYLHANQVVQVRFDALPDITVNGKIRSIAGAPEPRAEWGTGRYVKVALDLSEATPKNLLPGMSARADVILAPKPNNTKSGSSAAP